jgi:acetoin utilization protein AcuB
MRAAEIMTKDVHTVPPEMAASDAWELMRRQRIHHLVVRGGTRVVGVLSDRDAGGRGGASLRARSVVADLMTAPVVTTDPDATVRQIANLMRGRTIGCLPVTTRGRVVGIVTVSDLLALLGRGVDRPAASRRRTLKFHTPHRKHRGAGGGW